MLGQGPGSCGPRGQYGLCMLQALRSVSLALSLLQFLLLPLPHSHQEEWWPPPGSLPDFHSLPLCQVLCPSCSPPQLHGILLVPVLFAALAGKEIEGQEVAMLGSPALVPAGEETGVVGQQGTVRGLPPGKGRTGCSGGFTGPKVRKPGRFLPPVGTGDEDPGLQAPGGSWVMLPKERGVCEALA